MRKIVLLLLLPIPYITFGQNLSEKRHIYDQLQESDAKEAIEASIKVWNVTPPESTDTCFFDQAYIYPIFPEKKSGSCVIIFPGGAYNYTSFQEGIPIGRRLIKEGITAFIVQYRVKPYNARHAFADGQKAIRIIRSKAKTWGLDPNKIGIIGFSAGGHLAGMLATQPNLHVMGEYNEENIDATPNLAALIYPVLKLGYDTIQNKPKHFSKMVLKTEANSPVLAKKFSVIDHVTENMPPVFLYHARNDHVVPISHTYEFAQKLTNNKIKYELHIPNDGEHGFGSRPNNYNTKIWLDIYIHWLKQNDW